MLRITQITQLMIFGFVVFIMKTDFEIGLIYLISVTPLIVMCSVIRKSSPFFFTPVYAAIISIFIFYFIRPAFLVTYPDFYPYVKPVIVGNSSLKTALLMQGLFSISYLSFLYCVIHLPSKSLRTPLSEMRNSRISQLGSSFIGIMLVFSLAWFALIFTFDVARKGLSSNLELLRLVLPVTLIIPALVGFLGVGEIKRLSKTKIFTVALILLSNVLVIVLTGSKAGIFLLSLYVFFFLCLKRGNFRISIVKTLSIVLLFVTLVFFSTVFANSVKYKGVSSEAIDTFSERVNQSSLFLNILDGITWRLNGYDGSIAVVSSHPSEFEQFVTWPSIFKQSAAQLLPGVSTNKISIGKAVGVVFDGRSLDASHAGALGMFAIAFFQGGWFFGFFTAGLIAIMFGTLYRKMARLTIRGAPERIIACIVVLYLQAFWLSSGNFDKLVQQLVVTIVHMVFYYNLLKFFTDSSTTLELKYRDIVQ